MVVEYPKTPIRTTAASGSERESALYMLPADGLVGNYDDRLGFIELCVALWNDKWLILGVAAIFSIITTVYVLVAPAWYRAEVLLMPVSAKSNQGLSGQLSALSGLASLAGVSIGGDKSVEPVAVLGSRDFARAFIEQHQLMPVLFSKKWNAQTGGWIGSNKKAWPDIRDGVKFFDEEVRRVRDDKKSGLVTLTVDWTDPALAAEWANLLVAEANVRMRSMALSESQANVDYLQKELAGTNVVVLQQSIGRLLESEMQKLMVAKGTAEYAFRVIDRAEVSKWRYSPKRALWVITGGLLGGVVGIFMALIRQALRRRQAALGPGA